MHNRLEVGRAWGVVLLLVLVAAGGVAVWYFFVYVRSPQYALNQFLNAAKAGDEARATERLDLSGMVLGQYSTMVRNFSPTAVIYPGFKEQGDESVVKATLGTVQVKENQATVPVTLELSSKAGKKRTIRPNYILRKDSNGKWKIAVEATFFGSFNEFVVASARAQMKKAVQQAMAQNPAAAVFIKQQLQMVADQYPQLKYLLEP